MRLDRFTQKAQQAVQEAMRLAEINHNTAVEPEHLLQALLDQEGGVVPALVNRTGGDLDRAAAGRPARDQRAVQRSRAPQGRSASAGPRRTS